MFVFLFEHVKLRSIIIIRGTNERCSACSNNRTNTNNYAIDVALSDLALWFDAWLPSWITNPVGLVTIYMCGVVEVCLWPFCNWKIPWNNSRREGNFFPFTGFYLVIRPKLLIMITHALTSLQVRPLQFNYLSYKLFGGKKSCQTPKKKKKKVIFGVLRTKVVLKFSVRLQKKKKKCKF